MDREQVVESLFSKRSKRSVLECIEKMHLARSIDIWNQAETRARMVSNLELLPFAFGQNSFQVGSVPKAFAFANRKFGTFFPFPVLSTRNRILFFSNTCISISRFNSFLFHVTPPLKPSSLRSPQQPCILDFFRLKACFDWTQLRPKDSQIVAQLNCISYQFRVSYHSMLPAAL